MAKRRNFIEMLKDRWARGRFVCVGLDSDYETIRKKNQCHLEHYSGARWPDVITTVVDFNEKIVNATQDLVCAYKPNIAFYEGCGADGLSALKSTIWGINEFVSKVPIILDFESADIGNTNARYVWLAFDYLKADAITVNPYFGSEALQPFLDCVDKGIFVLCRTSNPGSDELQNLPVALTFTELVELVGNHYEANFLNGLIGWKYPTGGYRVPFYQYVALRVSRHWNKNGNCGLVVGATYPEELAIVRKLVGDMPILIPGIGVQGGDIEKIIVAGKDNKGQGMIINSSRGIIFSDDPRRETIKISDSINMCQLGVKI